MADHYSAHGRGARDNALAGVPGSFSGPTAGLHVSHQQSPQPSYLRATASSTARHAPPDDNDDDGGDRRTHTSRHRTYSRDRASSHGSRDSHPVELRSHHEDELNGVTPGTPSSRGQQSNNTTDHEEHVQTPSITSMRRGTFFGLYSSPKHSALRQAQLDAVKLAAEAHELGIDPEELKARKERRSEERRSRHAKHRSPRHHHDRSHATEERGKGRRDGDGHRSHRHSGRHGDTRRSVGSPSVDNGTPNSRRESRTPGSGGSRTPRSSRYASSSALSLSVAPSHRVLPCRSRHGAPADEASPPVDTDDNRQLRKEARRLRQRLRSMSQRLTQQRTLISQQRTALRDAQVAVSAAQDQARAKVCERRMARAHHCTLRAHQCVWLCVCLCACALSDTGSGGTAVQVHCR